MLLDVWDGDYDVDKVQRNLELRDGVEQALRQLPDRYIDMLRVMYGVDGGRECAPGELIAILGITRQAINVRKHKAHTMLAPLLRAYFELDESEAAG
jgi:hypothetical protein